MSWGVLGVVATAGCSDALAKPPAQAASRIDSPRPGAGEEPERRSVKPCDDPLQQLSCYCGGHGFQAKVAGVQNIVAPCYPSSVQTPTALFLGLFSVWSWTASNWPVNAKREPDYTANLGDRADHATVWETWKTSTDVFLPDGRPPPGAASEKRLLPAACRAIDLKAAKAQYPGWEKVPSELPPRYLPRYEINEENDYVVDRDGQPLHVEIAMNQVAFDYIYAHRLYSEDGQRAFVDGGGKIDFPMGEFGTDKPRGAHFVKAAWKILGPGDDFDQFHKAWAYVEPWFEKGTIVEDCHLAVVGLVGAHLTSKLDQAPRWSWATFEHVSNAPTRRQVRGAKDGQYLFFTPGCSPPRCAEINKRPEMFPPGAHPQLSNLVMEQDFGEGEERKTPNDVGSAVWANRELAKSLPGSSVFRNYKLKGTQWFDDSISPKGRASPQILANTLLEAYVQKTSACLDCHQAAGLTGPPPTGHRVQQKYLSDFVFVLHEAKPEMLVE